MFPNFLFLSCQCLLGEKEKLLRNDGKKKEGVSDRHQQDGEINKQLTLLRQARHAESNYDNLKVNFVN